MEFFHFNFKAITGANLKFFKLKDIIYQVASKNNF